VVASVTGAVDARSAALELQPATASVAAAMASRARRRAVVEREFIPQRATNRPLDTAQVIRR
jgi:hypothetical protein